MSLSVGEVWEAPGIRWEVEYVDGDQVGVNDLIMLGAHVVDAAQFTDLECTFRPE